METSTPGFSHQIIREFLQHVRVLSSVSQATLEAYGLDVLVLARWAAARGACVETLDTPTLRQFFADRIAAGCSPSTIARQLTSCRKFYGFLAVTRGGTIPTAGLRSPVRNPPRAPLLPAAALTAVAHAVSARSGDSMADYRRRRDHAMACLLMSSGMLVSAIRTLRWDNIDPDWCRIRCAAGTPQEQTYQLRGDARQAMLDLRKQANLEDLHSDYCFPSSRGRPLSRQGLCQRIRKFGRDIGVALVVTPTALRRAAPHYYKRRSLYRASAGAG